MRAVECTKCLNKISVVEGINSRVIRYERVEHEFDIELCVFLGVYCANCGREETLLLKHYFYKPQFEEASCEFLLTLTLRDLEYCEEVKND